MGQAIDNEGVRQEMFEIFARLVERLAGQPPLHSSNEDLAPWLAAILVGTLAAIIYGAPRRPTCCWGSCCCWWCSS